MTFVMGGVLTLAPGSDRIPVELLQILTQYAICRLPANSELPGADVCQLAAEIRLQVGRRAQLETLQWEEGS